MRHATHAPAVAHALLRAALALLPTQEKTTERSHECERCTHECVRYGYEAYEY